MQFNVFSASSPPSVGMRMPSSSPVVFLATQTCDKSLITFRRYRSVLWNERSRGQFSAILTRQVSQKISRRYLESLRQTATFNLYHVTKYSLHLSFKVNYS